MEQYEQIVYTNKDSALVIVPSNKNIETKIVFELTENLLILKDLCQSKIDGELKYVVAYKGTNIMNIESENANLQLDITTLNESENNVVQNAILDCLNILNK